MKKRTTIWLDDTDRAALAKIRERYGVATDSDVVRLALRILAASARVNIQQSETPSETPEVSSS